MKILIVSETFRPTAANTVCLKALVDEMIKRGHQCKIVTKLGLCLDSNVNLEYIESEFKNNKILETRLGQKLHLLLSYFTWPRFFFNGYKKFLGIVEKEINREKPDVVFGTCFSYNNLIVSNIIKQKYGSSIKYVAYFLDAIYCGAIPSIYSKKTHDKKALKAEIRVLMSADLVIMMKAAENKYQQNKDIIPYYNKILFLDIPLFIEKKNDDLQVDCKFTRGNLNLFFAGSLPNNIRSPYYLLKLFSKLDNPDVHLNLAGNFYYKAMVDKFVKANDNIHNLGLLSRDEVMSFSNNADVLVNIGNAIATMTPSKIFECMSSGKPFLTTTKMQNDPCLVYYKLYPNCLIIDETRDFDDNLIKLKKFIHEVIEGNINKRVDDSLFENNKPSKLVDVLEALMPNKCV